MLPIFPNNAKIRAWLTEQTGSDEQPIFRIAVSPETVENRSPIKICRFGEDDPDREDELLILQSRGYKLFYESVAIYGSGPFSFEDYLNFLETNGVFVSLADSDTYGTDTTLVVGNDGYEESILEQYIDRAYDKAEKEGSMLRIYSQEMYLFYMMSGIDLFDAPRSVLEEFGEGHPVLKYLMTRGFDWPSCQRIPSPPHNTLISLGGKKRGLLSYVGYHVGGESAIEDARERQRLLTYVWGMSLSDDLPVVNLQEWGEPKTWQRLRKLARSLSGFANLRLRQSASSTVSIDRWKLDLEWLRTKYYKPSYGFRWPSIT